MHESKLMQDLNSLNLKAIKDKRDNVELTICIVSMYVVILENLF